MATREQNEKRFPFWENLPHGGRRYYRQIQGRIRGFARYIKVVDAQENTVSIVQEIYTEEGKLIGLHQKYPEDTGHQTVEGKLE